jgi:branched-subunit amino acid aminotransferase/4-amino-4-deoxychorismate lyase
MRGATAISVHYERLFPNAKTLNMLASYLAYKKAQTQGCYDALLLTPQNEIFEGTRTNFFAIKEKTLFTAPSEKILEGVSRMTVIAVAKKMGLQMKEFPVALSEIGKYDGAFVTSTSSKIMPLRQIDDYHLPSIPDTLRELMKSYDNFLNSCGGVFINVL